jgi:peptidoglycan/LPS O-acetylase OafA/YrhL
MKTYMTVREKISYLRGVAIIAVLINHYIIWFITRSIEGVANGIISIFFITSGYGVYISLEKNKEFTSNTVKNFFLRRFSRIYPLYLFSLLLYSIYLYSLGATIYDFPSVLNYFAFPFYQAPRWYWFIPSLLQCYLISPFLYLILKKYGINKTLAIIIALMFITHISYVISGLPISRYYFVYRLMFLSHIFIFSLSFCLPGINKDKFNLFSNHASLIFSFLFFMLMVYLTRFNNIIINNSAIIVAPVFVFSTFIIMFCIVNNNIVLPFKKIINYFGNNSYPIYLFHFFYFYLLEKFGLITHGSTKSIIFTLILLPIFLLTCVAIEKSTKSMVSKFTSAYSIEVR